MTERSEFGRGLLTCLVAFLDHKGRLHEQLHLWREMHRKQPGESARALFTEEGAVELWANGASDHLYELTIPPRLQGTPLAAACEAFRDRWLKIGHSFAQDSGVTVDEAIDALHQCERLALEVAAEMDKVLGLADAEVGEWT